MYTSFNLNYTFLWVLFLLIPRFISEWINTLVSVRNLLPPLNFLTLHYAYFMFVGLLSAVIFWGASKPSRSIDFTDALFLCFSAMTGAGLNTVCIERRIYVK
jgi:hypothetical protein